MATCLEFRRVLFRSHRPFLSFVPVVFQKHVLTGPDPVPGRTLFSPVPPSIRFQFLWESACMQKNPDQRVSRGISGSTFHSLSHAEEKEGSAAEMPAYQYPTLINKRLHF